jgi:hypothetical protein
MFIGDTNNPENKAAIFEPHLPGGLYTLTIKLEGEMSFDLPADDLADAQDKAAAYLGDITWEEI